jgi:molecular chaperone DnaK (HSP70)
MRVGIDFGTTHTVVAAVDRGNYPVVSFFDDAGDAHEFFPSVVAVDEQGAVVCGFAALAAAARGCPAQKSFKRVLADPAVNAATVVPLGPDHALPVLELLTLFARALRVALLSASNAPVPKAKKKKHADAAVRDAAVRVDVDVVVDAVVAVPAHAHSAQRFLTLEAFRRAGFAIVGLVNEPSAAGYEFTHRRPEAITQKRTRVVVYDLGGGTFDASVIDAAGLAHDVVATVGHNRLGGDDFDAVLVDLACAAAHVDVASLSPAQRFAFVEQCREAKERLTPQAKRIPLAVPVPVVGDVGAGVRDVVVDVDAFFAGCAPLVDDTLRLLAPLVGPAGHDKDLAGIYVVGGGSALPLVSRVLRERYGRRVHRSAHAPSSTAIGLAIAADADSGFSLKDRLARGFGVFREGQAGRLVRFDPIFVPDTPVPAREPVVVVRRYRAAHNVGCYRFVECSTVDAQGAPSGDVVPVAALFVPFDPALRTKSQAELAAVPVVRGGAGPLVEERYVVDAAGIVDVEFVDVDAGVSVQHRFGA